MAYSPPANQDEADDGLRFEIEAGSYADVVKYLSDFGSTTYYANPDKIYSADNMTPLMISATEAHVAQTDVTTDLLQGTSHPTISADPDLQDSDNGSTCMMYAYNNSRTDLTSIHITEGANVDIKDDNGFSALTHTIIVGSTTGTTQLIDAFANLNSIDTSNRTALHHCSINDRDSQATQLIVAGVSINLVDSNSRSALHQTAISNTDAVTTVLVTAGANADLVDTINHTALMYCAENDYVLVATEILGGTVNLEIAGGQDTESPANNVFLTALMWAAYFDSGDTVLVFIDAGASLTSEADVQWIDNTQIFEGTVWNALWIATFLENTDAITKMIGGNGYSADKRDGNHFASETILMFAIRMELNTSVTTLLAEGSNINQRDDVGRVPVVIAFETENQSIADLIFGASGLDPEKGDLSDKSPLMVASEKSQNSNASSLLALDASISTKDSGGLNALMYAAGAGHLTVVQTLLASGASIDARDLGDKTALLHAANMTIKGYKDVVDYLITQNANVNASDSQDQTALMWAAKKDYTTTITALAVAGANVDAQSSKGWSALKWAIEWENSAAEALLRTYASDDPEIVLESGTASFVSDESIYDFGTGTVDGQGTPVEFKISNFGTESLLISNIFIESNAFVLDITNTVTTIVANSSTIFTVRFDPKEVGVNKDNMIIYSNDPDEGEFNITVLGIGEEA